MKICSRVKGAKSILNRLWGLISIFDKTATMLKCTAHVAYPVHVVLQKCSAVHCRLLVVNRLTFVGSLAAKMDTCKENGLRGEGMGGCVHCWFTATEEMLQRKG